MLGDIWTDARNNFSHDWLLTLQMIEILNKSKTQPELKAEMSEYLRSIQKQIESLGAKGTIMVCDLTQTDSFEETCESIETPKIDLIVNNAGMAIVKPFEQLTLEDWNRTFAANRNAIALPIPLLAPC